MEVNEEDSDDPVVAEFDVQLVKVNGVYQMQIPLECASVYSEGRGDIGCRYKQRMQRLQLETRLDTRAKCYSSLRAQELAGKASSSSSSGSAKGQQPAAAADNSGRIETARFGAELLPDSSTRNALLYWHDAQFCLTPLNGTFALRPNLDYIDSTKPDADKAAGGKGANDSLSESDAEGSSAPATQAVRVRFGRDESALPKTARRRHETQAEKMKRLNESDPWLPMQYNRLTSPASEAHRRLLLVGRDKMDVDTSTARPDQLPGAAAVPMLQFIRTVCPEPAEQKTNCDHSPTLHSIQSLTHAQQIQHFFKRVHVFTWAELKSRLRPAAANDEALLALLQPTATLCCGCWVLKSELAYPPTYVSPLSGCAHGLLQKARDYVLYSFSRMSALRQHEKQSGSSSSQTDDTEREVLTRAAILTATHIPEGDLDLMLSQIGQYRPAKGWRFIKPADKPFVKRFPEVVERCAEQWEARWQTLQLWVRENALAAEAAASKRPITSKRRRYSSNRRRSRPRTMSTSLSMSDNDQRVMSPPPSRQQRSAPNTASPVASQSPPLSRLTSKAAAAAAEPEHSATTSNGHNNGAANDVHMDDGDSDEQLLSKEQGQLVQELVEALYEKNRVLSVGHLLQQIKSDERFAAVAGRALETQLISTVSAASWLQKVSNSTHKRITAEVLASVAEEAVSTATVFIDTRATTHAELRQAIASFLSVRKTQKFRLSTVKGHVTVPDGLTDAQLMHIMLDYCSNTSGLYQLKQSAEVADA